MGNPHYRNARQQQGDDYATEHARQAITRNYHAGLLGEPQAIHQLREAGLFETEIVEALS